MKLIERNDWGTIYYRTAEGLAPREPLYEGKMVQVLWPDETSSIEKIAVRHSTTTVSDHGKSYGVEQVRLGFMVDHHGVEAWVPIDKVEIDL